MKEKNGNEKNKELIKRAAREIWNAGNFENVEKIVSSDFIVHAPNPDEEVHGPEGVRLFYTQLREAFPDIQFSISEQIAEGDRVVTHLKVEGTHQGEFMGIPPTGKKFSVTAIDIDRISNGKVVECWTNLDKLTMLQQLGVIQTSHQL